MKNTKEGGGARPSKNVIISLAIAFIMISSAPFLFTDNNKNSDQDEFGFGLDQDLNFDFNINEFLGAGDGGSVETVTIAGGRYHSLALKSDGTVWAWGSNGYGQLGDGSAVDEGAYKSTPVQVKNANGTNLSGVTAISAGYNHSLALKSDGTVWAWGTNYKSQLGDGSESGTGNDKNTPVQVKGLDGSGNLTSVTAISAGWDYSFALKSDGTVWSWGFNTGGQLGAGSITQRNTPVQVSGGLKGGAISIAAGSDHTIALKGDGTVWAWGSNGSGQLGIGTSGTGTEKRTPVQVPGLSNVIAIAAGNDHSLALKSDGTVWAWGWNNSGQLGNVSTTSSNVPVQVRSISTATYLTGVSAIAAGGNHSLALVNGMVLEWGAVNSKTRPTAMSSLSTDVIAIAAGYNHSLALKSNGTVWAWGSNSNGQLGNGGTTNSSAPVQVLKGASVNADESPNLERVAAISAGNNHSVALTSDGKVWSWGQNDKGQLGNNSYTNSSTPVGVVGGGGGSASPLTGVSAISAGSDHSLALQSNGTVSAWGHNLFGQLGVNNDDEDRNTYALVSGVDGNGYLNNAMAIAGGGCHSVALTSDGKVLTWGLNFRGQLGNNANANKNAPVLSGFGLDAPAFDSANNTSVVAGTGKTFSVSTTGTAPITYSLTGAPTGVSINPSSGSMTIPSTLTVDEYKFTITASNIAGTTPQEFTLTVTEVSGPPVITTTSLPNGVVGTAYNQTLTATGTSPITWSVSSGSLPNGLSLNAATGVISGTPTTATTYNFTVTATNGTTPDSTKTLSITITGGGSGGGSSSGSGDDGGISIVVIAAIAVVAVVGVGAAVFLIKRK